MLAVGLSEIALILLGICSSYTQFGKMAGSVCSGSLQPRLRRGERSPLLRGGAAGVCRALEEFWVSILEIIFYIN